MQVTVEYASRIRRLVQGLRSGRLQPDLVCFTGGVVRDNKVADASAGYMYFRHLCEQHKARKEEGFGTVVAQQCCYLFFFALCRTCRRSESIKRWLPFEGLLVLS